MSKKYHKEDMEAAIKRTDELDRQVAATHAVLGKFRERCEVRVLADMWYCSWCGGRNEHTPDCPASLVAR